MRRVRSDALWRRSYDSRGILGRLSYESAKRVTQQGWSRCRTGEILLAFGKGEGHPTAQNQTRNATHMRVQLYSSMKIFSRLTVRIAAIMIALGIATGPGRAALSRPLGIDASHYQGPIVWTNVAASGISFAWCKATEGLTIQDATFRSNIVAAKSAGVIVGAYHFAHPEEHIGTNGADEEAAFFWSVISPYIQGDGLTLMPALDYETAPGGSYTAATSSAWVNEWCQDIVNYGASNGLTVVPVVYTYTSFTSSWLNNTVTNWALWMASPNGKNPQTGAPSSTSPWATWQFWQYGEATIPGVTDNPTDTDVFDGTLAMLTTNFVVTGGAPFIATNPVSVTIIQGGTANFMVGLAETFGDSYQWSFDTTNQIAGATNDELTLTNAQVSEDGKYSVVVSNAYGFAVSSNAILTVIPMISNVTVMARLDSAIITWSSATNATGEAFYSPDLSYSQTTPLNATMSTQHSVLLQGLQTDATYNFQLVSTNELYNGTYNGSFSTDGTLILESSQAYYSGIWTVDSAAPDKYDQYYEYAGTSAGGDTATAFFRPNILSAGLYDVYFWYSQGTNRSQYAPVVVGYEGGDAELVVNEQTNGGSWQLLASAVPFAAGTNGYVRLGNGTGEANKVVIADAVKLVYTANQDLPANNTPPAWWMSYYYGTNAVSPASDTDGDGYSAYAEYVAGTDPTSANSHLSFTAQPTTNGGVQVVFSPYYINAGRQYQLQSRTTLTGGAWVNLPTSAVTTNASGQGVLTLTNLSSAQSFLRLSVTMTQQ